MTSEITDSRSPRESPTNGDSSGEPSPEIVPFGRYGAGRWTGHPIGLLIVVGLLLMSLVGLPESRLLSVASLALGGLLGFILWRLHRQKF